MSSLPSIGVVTTSTNSVSRGYLSFLACVETWSSIADQMVIVDGGTNDGTYDVLKNWSKSSNYSVYTSPETYWDLNGRFHLAQWGINTRIGMEQLRTDWAIIVPGDHVLDLTTADPLRRELLAHEDSLALRFKRQRFRFGHIETDYKFYCLNLKKIRANNINIAWGFDRIIGSTPDDPIVFDEETSFHDAVNGCKKRHLGGITLKIIEKLESLTCWSYGFYFFSCEQALAHLIDFYLCYNFRYFGRPVKSEKWFMKREHLDKISGFVTRDEELKKKHSFPVRRLIDSFYKPDMIGSAIYSLDQKQNRYLDLAERIFDKVHTLWFIKSGFPSIVTRQKWSPLGKGSLPLDLAQLFTEQDTYLPSRFRCERSRV